MPGISASRIPIPFGSSGSYWTPQKIAATFEDYYPIIPGTYQANDHILSTRRGSTAYLTVIDATPGAETFQCPDNATYKTADTDFIWFNQIGDKRTVKTEELNGYDLQSTPVRFDDDSPNTLRIIAIKKAGVIFLGTLRDQLFSYFQLPIFWDDSLNAYGHVKSNRIGQNLWVKEEVLGAEIVLPTWCAVGLAYWDEKGAAWSGDDVKIIGVDANNVALCKLSILSVGKKYRINTNIAITSGSIRFEGFATAVSILLINGINSIKTPTIAAGNTSPYFYPALFNGLITEYSIKEILYE